MLHAAGVIAAAAARGAVVPGNFPGSMTVQDLGGSGVNGPRVQFGSDGTTSGATTGTGSPSITEGWGNANWFQPTATGVGASYWIKITATSGAFTSNGASGWTSLASAVACTLTQSSGAGTSTVTFRIQIATDAAGANVVFDVSGNTMTSVR